MQSDMSFITRPAQRSNTWYVIVSNKMATSIQYHRAKKRLYIPFRAKAILWALFKQVTKYSPPHLPEDLNIIPLCIIAIISCHSCIEILCSDMIALFQQTTNQTRL